ncbi:fucolectin-like [Spea bombifrons]|uniref:fucolectin-like n=1 Tax=Spea bombifrons TaxID=233779 RepID=UPI002348F57D|nr:fucolectin-like [Spea bombifrons]
MHLLEALLLCLAACGLSEAHTYCSVKGKNIAPEGKASQISVYHGRLGIGTAQSAIDGNREGVYNLGSCILTRSESNPWWKLDFHKPRKVGAVVLVNRIDCCWERLMGAEVRIGNSMDNKNPVCGTVTEVGPGLVTTFCCQGMEGRYVSVVNPGYEGLMNLCEVEVYPEGSPRPCL